MGRAVLFTFVMLLSLFATGVVDLDVFVHHDPHEGCEEGLPAHSEGDDHSHAPHCCAGNHLTVAPEAGRSPVPEQSRFAAAARTGFVFPERPREIFHPPRG